MHCPLVKCYYFVANLSDDDCSHLIQCGLGNRVVLYSEEVFVLGKDAEDVSEGTEGWGQLILQHVSVLLLQYTAWQLTLYKLHHGLQVRVWACYPQDDGVSITKPVQWNCLVYKALRTCLKLLGITLICLNVPDKMKMKASAIRELSPVFQVLDAAQTPKSAVYHDGHPGAQCFTLLHTVEAQNKG